MRMNWWLGSEEFLKITSVIRRLLIFFLLLLLMLRKNSLLKIIFKTFYASKWIPFVLSNIQEFSSEKIVAAQAGVAILKFMKKHSESNLFLFNYLFYLFSTPQLLYAYDCLEIVHDLFLTLFCLRFWFKELSSIVDVDESLSTLQMISALQVRFT